MARSKKKVREAPATEPIPIGQILEHSPAARMIANHELHAEPDQPMAEQEAIAAFQWQREREQAVSHVEQLGPRKRHPNELDFTHRDRDLRT